MPRKKEEQEMDLGPVTEEKKPTWAVRWFEEHAVENKKELRFVCDLTARSVAEQFNFHVKSGNTEVFAVIFYATFMCILEFLKSKEKIYNDFTIQIANSINIGYTNNDDENNEKVGNFMPIMEHIAVNRAIIDDGYQSYKGDVTSTNFIRWKQLNVKQEVEYYKEIETAADYKLRNEYNTSLRTEEAIIPIFCIFMDHIAAVAKQLYKEAQGTNVSEISMNVFNLFSIYYSIDDDGNEIIEYTPSISFKLFLKDDQAAARE